MVSVLFRNGTRACTAGYEEYRRDFSKLIWKIASPKWDFDDATFDRSAASFDNPDHVDIVIHNYRWRLDLVPEVMNQKYDRFGKSSLPRFPSLRYRRSRWRVTPTVRRTRIPVPMPGNSRASTRTGTSKAASGTTCLKKRHRPLPTRSSRSTVMDPGRPQTPCGPVYAIRRASGELIRRYATYTYRIRKIS